MNQAEPVSSSHNPHPEAKAIALISTSLLAIVLWLHMRTGVPIEDLTRDVAAVVEIPVYVGFLSYVSILLWTAAAVICLFSALIMSRKGGGEWVAFLGAWGGLTVVLALDDLFLLHEWIAPVALGIPEEVVVGGYGVFAVGCLVRFRGLIRQTKYRLLGAALLCFGLSIGIDMIPEMLGSEEQLGLVPASYIGAYFFVEDGLKLVGILYWLAYFGGVSILALERPGQTEEAPQPALRTVRPGDPSGLRSAPRVSSPRPPAARRTEGEALSEVLKA